MIMKKEIQVFDYAKEILQALKTGALLTTKADDFVNSMTISWGTLGIEWNMPIFTTFVRTGRHSRLMLDKNPEFTINVPYGDYVKNILSVCGRKSGRDVDKIKELSLTLVDGDLISVPAIKELPLTLECKVIYVQPQDASAIPAYIKEKNYPQNIGSTGPLANKDFHIAYYGEIVKAYIIES